MFLLRKPSEPASGPRTPEHRRARARCDISLNRLFSCASVRRPVGEVWRLSSGTSSLFRSRIEYGVPRRVIALRVPTEEGTDPFADTSAASKRQTPASIPGGTLCRMGTRIDYQWLSRWSMSRTCPRAPPTWTPTVGYSRLDNRSHCGQNRV